jgi:hypothetical protein
VEIRNLLVGAMMKPCNDVMLHGAGSMVIHAER